MESKQISIGLVLGGIIPFFSFFLRENIIEEFGGQIKSFLIFFSNKFNLQLIFFYILFFYHILLFFWWLLFIYFNISYNYFD